MWWPMVPGPSGAAPVGGLGVLAVAGIGAEAAVPGVDGLVRVWTSGAATTVSEGREGWQDVRVGWSSGAASAAAIAVREAPVVDESLVEDRLVVDVLRRVLGLGCGDNRERGTGRTVIVVVVGVVKVPPPV